MTLTDKSARELARQIVKDANDIRVKTGRTNGEIVLHVFVPGGTSRTIKNVVDWEEDPRNERASRNRSYARDKSPNDNLVKGNKGLST